MSVRDAEKIKRNRMDNMKKGEIVSGKVIRTDYPNKGIVKAQDASTGEMREVVVKNALPGQTVTARINKKRSGRLEAQLLEVSEPAPNEKTPADGLCPHFGLCGGCCYRSLPYEDELAMKEAQIRRLLDSVIDTPYEYEPITHGPLSSEFRNKMEFSFGDEYKDGPLALGLHKRNSMYDIVPVTDCQMVDEGMRQILRATLEFYRKKGLPYYHKMRHDGVLRHLLLRKSFSEGVYMVALVTTGDTAALDLPGYVETLLALPCRDRIHGILHMVNDSVADTVASQKTTVLYGEPDLTERLLGLEFRISPFSFFQTNSLGAEVLYNVARSYVGETAGRTVFDLYSGTGTIAQMLAPVARHVVGVEIVEEAVEAARENAVRNHLDNCTFIAGDVLKKLDEIEERPDFIVLDPPRDGVHPKALEKITAYGVENMIYISCKPTSLVRDLEILQQHGYHVVRARAVDMFPGTAHVETVCLLSNQKKEDAICGNIQI